jgi:hypothetical protein
MWDPDNQDRDSEKHNGTPVLGGTCEICREWEPRGRWDSLHFRRDFTSVEALREHIKQNYPKYPRGQGYSYEEWLLRVLAWWEQQARWKRVGEYGTRVYLEELKRKEPLGRDVELDEPEEDTQWLH